MIMLIALVAIGCGDERFAPIQGATESKTRSQSVKSETACSDFSYLRPKVDFLFLWDNSGSSTFINERTKQALNHTIDLMSERFDYHILMAPLIASGNTAASFTAFNAKGLGDSANAILIDRPRAAGQLEGIGNTPSQGSLEAGAQRAVDLLKSNQGNGIFRRESHIVIVVMSNQDDNSWQSGPFPAQSDRDKYIQDRVTDLNSIKNSLNAEQLRFISIAPHRRCPPNGTKANFVYRTISRQFHSSDDYDLCSVQDFTRLFNGINRTIQDTIQAHVYNHGRVAGSNVDAIDEDEIILKKSSCPSCNDWRDISSNLFSYIGNTTRDRRLLPTKGEPITGHLIELRGDAMVRTPECISIRTKTAKEYYGYVLINKKPRESTIKLEIDGKKIPQKSQDGQVLWELLKDSQGKPEYKYNFQTQIVSPTDTTQIGQGQSGYFLKLYREAIYYNGAVVRVTFIPSAK